MTFLSFSVITCPVIAAPSHGMVSPVECEKSLALNYKTECYFACNLTNGYQLEGPKSISCLENGSWSADFREVICKGKTDAVVKDSKSRSISINRYIPPEIYHVEGYNSYPQLRNF